VKLDEFIKRAKELSDCGFGDHEVIWSGCRLPHGESVSLFPETDYHEHGESPFGDFDRKNGVVYVDEEDC